MPPRADTAAEGPAAHGVPTLGVEEEFFLLRRDGTPAPTAPDVLADLAGVKQVHHEWTHCQVEVVSDPALRLATLAGELVERRAEVGRTAIAHDCLLVAAGTPPRAVPLDMPVSDDPRYARLVERYGRQGVRRTTCACHVHVAVPTRDLGVTVLNRIRGWLPVLLAVGANSPLWEGEDTGWHSYRHVVQAEWPSATVPPLVADAAAYDVALRSTVGAGAALDVGGVYWLARLSSRYPTVEVRVADTGLTVADTVLTAALCRALVMTALEDPSFGSPRQGSLSEDDLALSMSTAAEQGLRGMLLDPEAGSVTVGGLVLHRLVQRLTPALTRAGDLAAFETLLRHRLRQRSGASRQLGMRKRLGPVDFVSAMADATLPRQSQDLARASSSVPGQRAAKRTPRRSPRPSAAGRAQGRVRGVGDVVDVPVSYTHLTLPTN